MTKQSFRPRLTHYAGYWFCCAEHQIGFGGSMTEAWDNWVLAMAWSEVPKPSRGMQ
jgi:hypothetical protein